MTHTWKPFLFQSPVFEKFKDNVITLQTQYRQTNADFIKGLNCLRVGDGTSAIPHLKHAGVNFVHGGAGIPLDLNFNETTIGATNKLVNLINDAEYAKIEGDEYTHTTQRRGHWIKTDYKEWGDIPDSVSLKLGTRVMVLRNLYGEKVVDPHKKVDTDAVATQPSLAVLWDTDGSVGYVQNETQDEEMTQQALLQANGDTGIIEGITNGLPEG